jgi:adenine-specific DNA-methyltransferase
LMSSIANETFITNKNLYSLISKDVDIRILLGVLNSRLLSYLYIRQVTQATKDDFPQVTIKDIMSLPYPLDDRIKKVSSLLISLVERMLVLQNQPMARTPQEQEMVKREIESTDRAIDKLVYELYGLTEEEIKTVEE